MADGEKAVMQGDPSVREGPLHATPPSAGLPGVPELALIRLDREVYGLDSGTIGWRSRIVSQLKGEGYEMNIRIYIYVYVYEPCLVLRNKKGRRWSRRTAKKRTILGTPQHRQFGEC